MHPSWISIVCMVIVAFYLGAYTERVEARRKQKEALQKALGSPPMFLPHEHAYKYTYTCPRLICHLQFSTDHEPTFNEIVNEHNLQHMRKGE